MKTHFTITKRIQETSLSIAVRVDMNLEEFPLPCFCVASTYYTVGGPKFKTTKIMRHATSALSSRVNCNYINGFQFPSIPFIESFSFMGLKESLMNFMACQARWVIVTSKSTHLVYSSHFGPAACRVCYETWPAECRL